MTKATELAIRAKAAIRYPGRRRTVTFRRRRNRHDGPWMWLAKRAVPMVIWGVGMWMVSIVIMALAMGVRL